MPTSFPPAMEGKSKVKRMFKNENPDVEEELTVKEFARCGVTSLICDLSTIVRGKRWDSSISQQQHNIANYIGAPIETVPLQNVAAIIVDFVFRWLRDGRMQTVYVALDKRHPFPARAMVSLHRASKLKIPDNSSALGAELTAITNDVFNAFNTDHPEIILTKRISINCQTLVGFETYKNDWQQLMLLTSVVAFIATPPPAGSKVLIGGIQRRHWLQASTLPLDKQVAFFITVFETELEWGSATLGADDSVTVSFNSGAEISRRIGVLLSRGCYDAERDMAQLSATDFVQMMLGELTVTIEINCAGEMSVVSTPGVSSTSLEQDQLAMSVFSSPDAWGPHVGMSSTSTVKWTGGDTDCSTIFALLYWVGRWPTGLKLITSAVCTWYGADTPHITVVSQPDVFTQKYLPYVPAFVLGSDYLLGRHGLAHTTACTSYFINGFAVHPLLLSEPQGEKQLLWQGHVFMKLANTTLPVGALEITSVFINTPVFLQWYRDILVRAPPSCKDRTITEVDGKILAKRFAWWISYCLNGHMGTLFHDLAPYPALSPESVNGTPVVVMCSSARESNLMRTLYTRYMAAVPSHLRQDDAVVAMATHRYDISPVTKLFYCVN